MRLQTSSTYLDEAILMRLQTSPTYLDEAILMRLQTSPTYLNEAILMMLQTSPTYLDEANLHQDAAPTSTSRPSQSFLPTAAHCAVIVQGACHLHVDHASTPPTRMIGSCGPAPASPGVWVEDRAIGAACGRLGGASTSTPSMTST